MQSEEVRLAEPCAAISGNHDGGPASLRILQAANEFGEVRDVWLAWTNQPEADPDLFSIHLRHNPGVVRPHVMVIYRSGRPDCILVGWLHQGPLAFKVGSFPLFRPDACIFRFVAGGFLGNRSRENAQILLFAIIKSIRKREAQAVEFSQLSVECPLYDSAKQAASVFCRKHFTPVQAHRYLVLPANFDEFLRCRSSESRQQFRRHARMLERDFPGEVGFQGVRNECDVEDFAREADKISQKSYQRASEAGFVNNLEMRETLRAAAKNEALRACLLYIGERPVAFASGIVCNKSLCGTFTGYDPAFKRYRPGLQTLMRLIEESCESRGGVLRIDAGYGDTPYKRELFDSSWEEGPVWIFAPTAAGLRLHVFKLVSTLLHCAAMWLFAKSIHLRKLKRMWRRKALLEFQRSAFQIDSH